MAQSLTIAITKTGTLHAVIPPGAATLHLVSSYDFVGTDDRLLGALITKLSIDDVPIAMTDRRLAHGFHKVEFHDQRMVRWTSGQAMLVLEPARVGRSFDLEVGALIDVPDANPTLAGDAASAGEPAADVAEPAPKRRGLLETVNRDMVIGWAWDGPHSEVPVTIRILANGTEIARVLANRYREDLERVGIGTGRHAFEFHLPGGLSSHLRQIIEARHMSDGRSLFGSPKVIEASTGFDADFEHSITAIIDGLTLSPQLDHALHFMAGQVDRLLQRRADMKGERQARFAHRHFRLRWGTGAISAGMSGGNAVEIPDPGMRALVVDDQVPGAACDVGSIVIVSHMRAPDRRTVSAVIP